MIEAAAGALKPAAGRADEKPVGRRFPAAMLLAGAIAALAAAPASARPAPAATVNICDSAGSPNMLGVRARMPGGRAGDELYVSIAPQWWSRKRQQWLPVEGSVAVEVHLGDGDVRSRQGGWTFEFAPPRQGGYALRAAVGFQWRRGGEVVRSSSTITSGGMAGVLESDPPGYSTGVCILR